jgi:hypothetical protein
MSVSVPSAAELRRERILRNGQKRLDLLIGVKNAENDLEAPKMDNCNALPPFAQISSSAAFVPAINESVHIRKSSTTIDSESNSKAFTQTEASQAVNTHDSLAQKPNLNLNNNNSNNTKNSRTTISSTEVNHISRHDNSANKCVDTQARCSFNGYSNKEILIFFLIALFTSLTFVFEMSAYIYQVHTFCLY